MLQKWIAVAVLAGLGILCLYITKRIFIRIDRRAKKLHLRFLHSVIDAVILIIMIYSCLAQFEMTKDISKTVFQGGTLILAIATFAAQRALGNVISGFALSVSRPIEVGQKVKVVVSSSNIVEGIVQDMTMRQTVIRQYNGETCIVPNSVMDDAVIINSNYTGNVGNFIEVEIAYDADVDKATEILKEICMNEPGTIDADKQLYQLNRFAAEGVYLRTTVWFSDLNQSFTGCDHIRREILKQFAANGIEIPYNTVTINYKNGQTSTAE